MGTAAYVTVPRSAGEQELEAVASELRSVGLEFGEIETGPERFTGIEETLLLAIVVTSLHGFLTGLADEAGKDAYTSLKRLVGRLAAGAHREKSSVVVLQDQRTRARADLTPQLEDAAYRALFDLDFDALEDGMLLWDSTAKGWRQGR
jgi:hypothetical protein